MEHFAAGDALSRFVSARLDPNAPLDRLPGVWAGAAEGETSVELELISTGGDPEFEAERKALMAAHPEGRAATTIRYGGTPRRPEPETPRPDGTGSRKPD